MRHVHAARAASTPCRECASRLASAQLLSGLASTSQPHPIPSHPIPSHPAQLLSGLAFTHDRGIAHCDIKPENICILSASKRRFKIIDFGSATLQYDCHNSYVQSRWYRAPEVMLRLPWDT